MSFSVSPRAFFPLCLALALLGGCADEPAPPSISLYRALHTGDLDQLKRHLHWQTPIDRPDANGDLPLHVLARANRVVMARELLAAGANPEALNAQGATPLEVALANGKIAFAHLLLDHGVRIDAQQLLWKLIAREQADRDVLDFLLDAGAQINQADAEGRTVLHLAIAQVDPRLVARLLERGADVNQPDREGQTPLDMARAARARDPVAATIEELLVRYGAESSTDTGQDAGSRSGDLP